MTEQMTKLRGFDKHKSQASMPRLYEHIDRVDLWIMAQEQYHNECAKIYEARVQEIENKLECLLKHATGGLYSYSSYSKEQMYQMVDEHIERLISEALEMAGNDE